MTAVMEKTKIVIVDDHPLVRDGIAQLLEKEADFEVVGQAADGEQAIKLAAEREPDVVIMDIEMPKVDGLEATRQIKAVRPDTLVVVLTVHDDQEYIVALLEAGAAGYLLKTTYGQELVQAIRAIRLGQFILDTRVGPRVFHGLAQRSGEAALQGNGKTLSAEEMELAKLVGRGLTNKEISREMGVSLRVVKRYVSDIFTKLGVNSRVEVVTSCLNAGILNLDDISPK
jgi:NarL family two-component system response regulator LiaR